MDYVGVRIDYEKEQAVCSTKSPFKIYKYNIKEEMD